MSDPDPVPLSERPTPLADQLARIVNALYEDSSRYDSVVMARHADRLDRLVSDVAWTEQFAHSAQESDREYMRWSLGQGYLDFVMNIAKLADMEPLKPTDNPSNPEPTEQA